MQRPHCQPFCTCWPCMKCRAESEDAEAEAEGTVNVAFEPSAVVAQPAGDDVPIAPSNEAAAGASEDSVAVHAPGDNDAVANPPGDSSETSQKVAPFKNRVAPAVTDDPEAHAAAPAIPEALRSAPVAVVEASVIPPEAVVEAPEPQLPSSESPARAAVGRPLGPSPSRTPKGSRSDSNASSCQSSSGTSVQTVFERPPQVPRLPLSDSDVSTARGDSAASVVDLPQMPSSPSDRLPDDAWAAPPRRSTGNALAKAAARDEDGSVPVTPATACRPISPPSTHYDNDKDDKSPRSTGKPPKGFPKGAESKTSQESSQPPPPQEQKTQEKKATTACRTPSMKESTRRAPSSWKGMSSDEADDVTTLSELKKLNEIIDGEKYDVKHPFFDKISLFYGDITKIQVDAIVNAANSALMGGGGVDGAIHRAAGESALHAECRKHERPLATGNAVATDACRLSTHVKKIIHAVGPICHRRVTPRERKLLRSCYVRSMQLSEENDLRSIAFCCISTGIYGYSNDDAAHTVLKFLHKYFSQEGNAEKWDRVVLCLFMNVDKMAYKKYIQELVRDPTFFDEEESEEEAEEAKEDADKKTKDEKDEGKDGEKKDEKDGEKKEEKDGEKKEEKEEKKDGKDESDAKKESKKPEDTVEESPEAKKEDTVSEAKKEDTVSETVKTAVEGDKKEEAAPSASNTSTGEEKMEEEQEVAKGDYEKENDEVDGAAAEEGVTGKKRLLSEERGEGEPLTKRDKQERESAV